MGKALNARAVVEELHGALREKIEVGAPGAILTYTV